MTSVPPTVTAVPEIPLQDDRPGSRAGREGGSRWIRRLLGYCWRHRTVTLLAAVSAVVGVGLGALTPLLVGVAVDDATRGSTAGMGWIVTGLLALAVIRFGASFVRRWAGGRLSLDVQHDLRQDVFRSLQRLDGPGQDDLRTGQVVSRASSDLQLVQNLLAMVPLSAGQVVLFAASLGFMVTLSPLLTVMALLVVPAVAGLTRATRTVLFPATWAAQQSAADVAEIVEEDVTGVRVVKGFGQEDREVERLRTGAATLFGQRMRAVRLTALITPALQGLTSLGQVGVLALGGYLALRGTISLGTFLAFSLYLAQLVGPTRMLTLLLISSQQARASVERVLEIVDSQVGIVDPIHPTGLPAGPLAVRLDGVRFGYLPDEPVLDGFSLEVPAGSTTALVGASGSGKSTISLLLPRFYDPRQGSVSVGGVDVREVLLGELRRTVGVVFEEAFLFSDSIAVNIAYGRPDASREDIRAAARAAEADGFIEALPDGYDTVIGERGMTLSGGQRQRLALARAMITDPRVLLLDDATSAVDPVTEAAIHATLRTLTATRTTVLIAHRRSTLALADRIAVVEAGRVIDTGTHDELVERCAPYRDLLGGELAGAPAEHRPAPASPSVDGVTPVLWPEQDPTTTPTDRTVDSAARGGGGPGGGGMGGFMGNVPATPELLDRVAALPPVTETPGPYDPPEHTSFSLRASLRPVRRLLWIALVLVALDAVAGLAIPVLMRTGVDRGVSAGALDVVWIVSVAALAIVLADYFFQRGQMLAAGRAGETVLFRLRLREFAHLQRLGLEYYERERAGRIMTRMTTDVDALSSFLQTGLVTSVISLASFAGIAVVLLVLDVGLALLALSVLPVVVVATVVFRRFSSRAYQDAREKVSAVNADLQENVAGLRVSQALGRERRNAEGFQARSEDYRRSRMRAQTAISIYFPFVALLSEVAAAVVLGVGVGEVVGGTLTVGTLMAFMLYLDTFFQPIQQLSQVFDSYQQAEVGLQRIGELLRTPTTTPAAEHPRPVTGLAGDVRMDSVGFAYATADTDGGEAGVPALQDVDLHIAPGETVAVVGATGAGKSTMIKLLARYYDAGSGRVSVDDTDIREYDLGAYRRRIGVVPQEAHLFSGTVRDNIAYGRPDASDAEVEAAARSVGALTMVGTLTGGFRHRIDERGRNLSAGQRQLISLARAYLVDPDLLLLDEATAALDPSAEAAVLNATDRLARGRTTVVVAHRLTTAARADRIIVMERGRVVEVGRHGELLAAGGAYSRLYRQSAADGDVAAVGAGR
ncbi:ABC transporter ATP-binding protein [Nakamurella flavida]